MRLKDKVAIVTGSSKGIGEGIARIFYQEGAMVVIVGRNVDAGLKMALELGSEEGRSLFVKTDVRKSQEIREMIDKTVATFGKIDIVVTMWVITSRRMSLRPPKRSGNSYRRQTSGVLFYAQSIPFPI